MNAPLEPSVVRVLLVDDDPVLLQVVGRYLARRAFVTASATSAKTALELVESFDPEVILSDVRMPEMDGPELLQTLRRAGNQTPFVFLTGFRDLSVSELLALGAARVLDKPFEPAALAEALRAVVPAQASVSSR